MTPFAAGVFTGLTVFTAIILLVWAAYLLGE